VGIAACYSAGSGAAPPPNSFYFPVGLAVSQQGDALYVANSDFDLQWNGGTLQSYNLPQIRRDASVLIAQNLGLSTAGFDTAIPFVYSGSGGNCADASIVAPALWSNGQRPPLGMSCSPPVNSTSSRYQGGNAVIGAFASDLQLSEDGSRLFTTVRGDATLTWASLPSAPGFQAPTFHCPANVPARLCFDCGQQANGDRCTAQHQVGNNPGSDMADSRRATLPGEPFSFAQTENGSAIVVTQQATQETSVLLSGLGPAGQGRFPDGMVTMSPSSPSMQFVLEGVPTGGNGIVAVPHDPDGVRRCEDVSVNNQFPCVRAAFLQTTRSAAEVDLIRYYDDDGSSLHRPFLARESVFPINVNSPGIDQRGIVVDPTPRLQCKAKAFAAAQAAGTQLPGPGSPAYVACGQLPARVYIASRSPASVIFGTIGGFSPTGDGSYDPDQLHLIGNFPVGVGPSRLYLAPIVDASGHYAMRLFVVCYDNAQVYVFDPDQVDTFGQGATPEVVLNVGPGPFAMAFDPFCSPFQSQPPQPTTLVDSSGMVVSPAPLDCKRDGVFSDVATSQVHAGEAAFLAPPDNAPSSSKAMAPIDAKIGLRSYRFGYLATFTNSYLQLIDLDNSVAMPPGQPGQRSQETFETIVFNLGKATPPKGT
jgi:hypothetical protein